MAAGVSTYGELFQDHVLIALQNSTDPLYRRLFREWLEWPLPFGCEACHEVFTPDADVADADDPVLCARCVKDERQTKGGTQA